MKDPILITLGSLSYPGGSAPTNRIHLYSKALRTVGCKSLVISLDAPFHASQKFNYVGLFDGIPFCYSRKTYLRKANFFVRNIERVKGLITAYFIIRKQKRKNRNVFVLFFSILPADELLFSIFLKILKIKIIKEVNEAPWFIIRNKRHIKTHELFQRYFNLKKYDALIVISNWLREYYSKIYPVQRIFQIPILVDLERFKISPAINQGGRHVITYVGFMGGDKDGLEDLIDSFAIATRSVGNLTLNLVGGGFPDEIERIRRKIKDLNMSESVCLLGNKPSNEIPVILSNSDFLILARPNNSQAKAGFPTKLGEYLASGKPVIITKTGEVTNYLEDKTSAYLVEPGDVNSIAEKIIYAINDSQAEKIGLEGFKIAARYFDYKLYGGTLLNLLEAVLH